MRVALVHDYLTQMGGAEKVLLALHELFPQAPIYTSIYDPRRVDPHFRALDVRTSFLQRMPFARAHHRALLPLYPYAFERFDLRAFDLVVSDSSAFAKGIITRPETLHICYCHTPMRWAWCYQDYVESERLGRAARALLPAYITWLRSWDFATAARVDHFIANSPSVAARIAKYYRRDAVAIPPPVDTSRYSMTHARTHARENTYLIVSRLVPYKRIDLAVRAFTQLGVPLTIIGSGRDAARLRQLAGPSVRFLGHQSDEQVRYHLARCKALIFPGEEDFGLAPVEAQASGRPVIAFGAGGALASVVEGVTGEFFSEPTPEALADMVSRFDPDAYDPMAIRRHAEDFDTAVFLRRISQFIQDKTESHPVLARKPGPTYAKPGVLQSNERRAIADEGAQAPSARDTAPPASAPAPASAEQ